MKLYCTIFHHIENKNASQNNAIYSSSLYFCFVHTGVYGGREVVIMICWEISENASILVRYYAVFDSVVRLDYHYQK